MLFLLDGFSGYNQLLVANGDQLKKTFNTKWGTYAYRKMPFGLINVGARFQRAMDITFRGLINRSVVVYMDDITLYLYHKRDHIYHLKQIYERCRTYGISLNPKKSVFAVTEGKLLGHILSKEGIVIDPERIETIMRIQPPANKMAMKYFFGKINFARKFVLGFAEIVHPMQLMMKKDVVYRWSNEAKKLFQRIKEAIAEAPVLFSPNFDKEFLLYTFAFDVSYVAILTQKNDDGNEVPISYMSSNRQGVELNYPDVEKQGFVVFKVVKHFRHYLLKVRTKVIVPHPAIRALFMQK